MAVSRDYTGSCGSLSVDLLDVQKFAAAGGWIAGNSPSTTPTTSMQLFTLILYFLFNFLVVWSPKGTQLALGMQGGDVTYSPTQTSTLKSSIPHPASANGMSVISIRWLSTSSFHAIYARLTNSHPIRNSCTSTSLWTPKRILPKISRLIIPIFPFLVYAFPVHFQLH